MDKQTELWTREGWTLTHGNGTYKLWKHTFPDFHASLGYVGQQVNKLKLAIASDAFELYELAIVIKPSFAELVSIGRPIMRIPNE